MFFDQYIQGPGVREYEALEMGLLLSQSQIFETPSMELNTYNLDVQLVSYMKTLAIINRIVELCVSLLHMIYTVSY